MALVARLTSESLSAGTPGCTILEPGGLLLNGFGLSLSAGLSHDC